MKKVYITIVAVLLCFAGVSADRADGKIKINIILNEQVDAAELSRTADALPSKTERRFFVVNTLKRQAEESQVELRAFLNDLETNGFVEDIRPLWIVNSISCYANDAAVEMIKGSCRAMGVTVKAE